MKNILIIGCGLIGSSVLRAAYFKKLAKNIYIYEKSKKNISIIKRLKVGCKVINKFNNIYISFDLVIFCTPMSQYSKIIPKINKFLTNETIVTDVGSTKEMSSINVKKLIKKNVTWIPSHPIAGSEVSGAKYGEKNLFKNKWCVLIKEKNIKKTHLFRLKSFWKKLDAKVVTMSSKEHSDPKFREAVDMQWKNIDKCIDDTINRDNPDFSKYFKMESSEKRESYKRACWNSWIAPYNLQGFFMNFGDMLVKE